MDRVNGANTIDIGGGRRGFRSQDAGAGLSGTEVTALHLNAIQEELLYVIEQNGLVADLNDWTQVYQALQNMIAGIAFPGPADPPIAPNLPQLVASADGTQVFGDGVTINVTYSVLERNNLINSVWNGTVLTIGPSDEGLYLIFAGSDFIGGAGAYGLISQILQAGVAQPLARDNRTAATPSNLATNVVSIRRLVAGDQIHTQISRDDAGGGSNTPTVITTRFSATKLSV